MTLSISRPTPRRRAPGNTSKTQEQEPPTTAGLSIYIAEMTGELAKLARRANMPMLAYFLNLARVEAEDRAREHGGAQTRRRPRNDV
jgi:hypothetical protein